MKLRKLKDRLRDVHVMFCDATLFVSLFVHACIREIASWEENKDVEQGEKHWKTMGETERCACWA